MRDHHFAFRSAWNLPAPPAAVFDVLRDVGTYPRWWPQVRHARRLSDNSGELTCRSTLPYDLTFVLTAEVDDASARILRARMDGDLVGWSKWAVHDGRRGGSVAIFEEDVLLTSSLLRIAPGFVRPVLARNHTAMMRGGERGLRAYLARAG